jgi:hypothetical protein
MTDTAELLNAAIAERPEDEQHEAVRLCGNLIMLHRHSQNFTAAVGLLDYVDALRQVFAPNDARINVLGLWRDMACRDGVMSLYHFGEVLAALRRNPLPLSVVDHVDGPRIRNAASNFGRAFPTIRKARNGVGHVAEMTSSHGGFEKHAVDGSLFFGALNGRTYTITNDKAHHEIQFTAETFNHLKSVVREVFAAHSWLEGRLPEV